MFDRENQFVLKITASAQDLGAMQTAVGSLNAEPIKGHPPGTLLFAAYGATPIDDNRDWFAVDMEFHVLMANCNGWNGEEMLTRADRFYMFATQPRLAEPSMLMSDALPT